jgi:radical SAM superfamily enzyme YgiQ (UPF0313 family)
MEEEILLIDPPFQKFMNFSKGGIPLGLLYLAGELKKSGHVVSVFDSDYNPEGHAFPFVPKIKHFHEYLDNLENMGHPVWMGVASKIEELNPSVVGISMISTKYRSGLMVAKIAKDLGVGRVIVGGPHATILPGDILRDRYVDSVVQGEGEEIFERAMGGNGIIGAKRIEDLNSLVWPAREALIGLKDYEKNDLGYLITSRGCPGSCNFCCSEELWGKKIRKRDVDDVVAEMDYVHDEHKVNKFYLVDDTFTMSARRVADFCNGVRDRKYEWSCLTRVDCFNESMLENMASSGCSMIKVGVESGSQRVLDLMNKGTSVEQVEKAGALLNRHGMPWLAYVMVGVPGEKSDDVDETIALIEKVKPSYVSAAHYTPYFGTGFWYERNGKDFNWEQANHHSLDVLTGEVSEGKIMEFFKYVDDHNEASRAAHEIYKDMGK